MSVRVALLAERGQEVDLLTHEGVIGFDLGRPGCTGPAKVAIRDKEGRELARLEASPERFERHVVALPPSKGDMEIVFDTDTCVPGVVSSHSSCVTRHRPPDALVSVYPAVGGPPVQQGEPSR
jgi:hypothetical protein